MNKEVVFGVARHILTIAGGVLASKGYIEAGMVEGAVGAVLTIIGLAWSVADKQKS